jgi:hypothetical protein
MREDINSTFYQLRNRTVRLREKVSFQSGTTDSWYSKDPSGSWEEVSSTLLSKGSVTIQYMDDNLDGTQYRYYQKNNTKDRVVHQTGVATVRVGS